MKTTKETRSKYKQDNMDTALVIGGAVLVIIAIIFVILVFSTYTSDCTDYIINFRKIENVSVSDLAFFVEDYNKRLKGKFNSLDEDLKKELFELFNI